MQAFGEQVEFTSPNRVPVLVTAIFDRAYLELTPMGGGPQEPLHFGAAGNVTSRRPVLGVQLSQFPWPPQNGDAIRIVASNLHYTIQEVQEDGKGGAKLLLTKATA
jgi:hypothetical protein